MDNIHACAIVVKKFGILITGPAQSGKSTLADAIVHSLTQQKQFASWVADDQVKTEIIKNKNILIAKPMIPAQAEKTFFGIENIQYMSAAVIDLIVEIKKQKEMERMPENKMSDIFPFLPTIQVPEKNVNIAMSLVMAKLKII